MGSLGDSSSPCMRTWQTKHLPVMLLPVSRLDLVFHNIRDHLAALPGVLAGEGIRGAARERLLRHIQREEEEINQPILLAALEEAAEEDRGRLEVALDHSRLVVDFARRDEVSEEAAQQLAAHFQEEHDDGLLTAPDAPDAPRARAWTVGSLRKD